MRITKIPGQIVESVLSIAGIRIGTEEPHYIGTPVGDGVEVRRYGPRIAAETTVAADEDRARSAGFRRLARYIFGGNHRDEEIAMTAPVAQQSGRRGDAWFYDPPWTLPFRRRNEIAVPVAQPAP